MELMVNVTSCWHFSWIAWLVLTQERVQVSSKLCKTWRHGSNLPLLHRGCWLDMYYGQNHLPKRNPWSGRTVPDWLNLSSSLLLMWLCRCTARTWEVQWWQRTEINGIWPMTKANFCTCWHVFAHFSTVFWPTRLLFRLLMISGHVWRTPSS